ncbi:MAG: hypothetical protein Q4D81_10910 [Eubacteriales bacterium]|nr:hypothetical protein [Eubacteriales bacterium]
MNGIRVMGGISHISCAGAGAGMTGREYEPAYKYITITDRMPAGESRRHAKTPGQNANRAARPLTPGVQKNPGETAHPSAARRKMAGYAQSGQPARPAPAGRAAKSVRTGKSGRKSSADAGFPSVLRLLALAVVFACMLAGLRTMIRASSRPKEQLWKYYTTVEIGYGEDLEDVMEIYRNTSVYSDADSYVREVCEINGLPYIKGSIPELRAGTTIVIPYHSEERK